MRTFNIEDIIHPIFETYLHYYCYSHQFMNSNHLSNLWHIPPPVRTVSTLEAVDTLIMRTSKMALRDKLYQIKRQYPDIRNIRGDGNCFYRAIAFLHLKAMDNLSDFFRVFPEINRVDLTRVNYFPRPFESLTNSRAMRDQFRKGWEFLFGACQFTSQLEKQNYLMEMLNVHWLLDFFIVVYFRSLNLQYIKSNWARLREFTGGAMDLNDKLDLIATYGEDSEGIEIESMTMCLNEDIKIVFVREDATAKLEIGGSQMGTNSKVLLLTPGHYDILYNRFDANKLRQQEENYRIEHSETQNYLSMRDQTHYESTTRQPAREIISNLTWQPRNTPSPTPARKIFMLDQPQESKLSEDTRNEESRIGSQFSEHATVPQTDQSKKPTTQIVFSKKPSQILGNLNQTPASSTWDKYPSRSYKEIISQQNQPILHSPPIYKPNTGLVTRQEMAELEKKRVIDKEKVIYRPMTFASFTANVLLGSIIALLLYNFVKSWISDPRSL